MCYTSFRELVCSHCGGEISCKSTDRICPSSEDCPTRNTRPLSQRIKRKEDLLLCKRCIRRRRDTNFGGSQHDGRSTHRPSESNISREAHRHSESKSKREESHRPSESRTTRQSHRPSESKIARKTLRPTDMNALVPYRSSSVSHRPHEPESSRQDSEYVTMGVRNSANTRQRGASTPVVHEDHALSSRSRDTESQRHVRPSESLRYDSAVTVRGTGSTSRYESSSGSCHGGSGALVRTPKGSECYASSSSSSMSSSMALSSSSRRCLKCGGKTEKPHYKVCNGCVYGDNDHVKDDEQGSRTYASVHLGDRSTTSEKLLRVPKKESDGLAGKWFVNPGTGEVLLIGPEIKSSHM